MYFPGMTTIPAIYSESVWPLYLAWSDKIALFCHLRTFTNNCETIYPLSLFAHFPFSTLHIHWKCSEMFFFASSLILYRVCSVWPPLCEVESQDGRKVENKYLHRKAWETYLLSSSRVQSTVLYCTVFNGTQYSRVYCTVLYLMAHSTVECTVL